MQALNLATDLRRPFVDPSPFKGCTRYFDGCNTCVKGACTKMACRVPRGEPRCLDKEISPKALDLQVLLMNPFKKTPSAIPQDCVSYYDGCNTCIVENGVKKQCTKLMCIRQGEPKCKVYKNDLLL